MPFYMKKDSQKGVTVIIIDRIRTDLIDSPCFHIKRYSVCRFI